MANHHDLGYKLLFAHPELVRELLAVFTPLASVGTLDTTCFERINPSYVSDTMAARMDDLVWRVRVGEQWLYVYILLEFQSGIDRWMALRMQVYVGLLYQDLVKRHDIFPDGKLAPVFPLVFYNGSAAWNAHCELGALITPLPDGLQAFQPAQRYFLIDQQRLDPVQLARQHGLLSALFRFELAGLPDVLPEVLATLTAWASGEERQSLRRDVAEWIRHIVRRETGDADFIDALLDQRGDEMGARKFATWEAAIEDRGLQKGIQQGMQQGVQQGLPLLRRGLRSVLALRFGALPVEIDAIIDRAGYQALERWFERADSSASLADVFAPEAPSPMTPLGAQEEGQSAVGGP